MYRHSFLGAHQNVWKYPKLVSVLNMFLHICSEQFVCYNIWFDKHQVDVYIIYKWPYLLAEMISLQSVLNHIKDPVL